MFEFNKDGSLKISRKAQDAKNDKSLKNKAARQLKNDFFIKAVHERYGQECSACGSLKNVRIRQKSLEFDCEYDDEKPNCERCSEKHEENFEACLQNIELICDECKKKEKG